MSYHNRRLLRKRQNAPLPVYGSVVVGDPTPTASALAANTAAVSGSDTQSGIPLLVSTTADSSPTTASASPTSSSVPSSSGSQIPLGTVIGACVGAFIALVLAILLAIYCSKRQKPARRPGLSHSRNAANNSSRRRSHLEPWGRLNDDEDRWEGQQQMKQRPPSGPMEKLGAMFHRTPSTNSAEKSSDGHGNRESIGTMQHFAKYHPGLAAEMASQAAIADADAQITKPPATRPFMGRMEIEPAISWDGETVRGDSFLSLHERLSGKMSPTVMAAKSTPPATASYGHRWESAEVVHVDETGSEISTDVQELRNPFADGAGSVKSSVRSNPFFNARDKPQKRTLLPDSNNNSFSDSFGAAIPRQKSATNEASPNNSRAMQSLIAALEVSPEQVQDRLRVASMQSSYYSHDSAYVTGDEGEEVVSVTAFPYPPTEVPYQ
ncbi:hypothetical protein F5I97DRAFT_1467843 [Phlebopus sp. FC_14]|nr:hypothetical protein F5I97DRAFT_1467843 [Phlebopus sp. FC_14]